MSKTGAASLLTRQRRIGTARGVRSLVGYSGAAPTQPVKALGELEAAVMEHLWKGASGEAKAVHRALRKARGITLNTVQSTLKRLFDKGLLAREKVSHAYVYRPRLSRQDFLRDLLDHLVGDLLRREAGLVVQVFVDLTLRAGPDHLTALEAAIALRRESL